MKGLWGSETDRSQGWETDGHHRTALILSDQALSNEVYISRSKESSKSVGFLESVPPPYKSNNFSVIKKVSNVF